MLAYRHLFHAGNFADVFKHVVLTRLLLALQLKPKPFCYLDTHAGVGRYDLTHPWAQKAREYENGIARLWAQRAQAPAQLEAYLRAVERENPDGKLRFYPGSPRIAQSLLRPRDRAVLTELNTSDFKALKNEVAEDGRFSVHHLDGYQAMKAFLPPKERRGLLLLDSSFDRAREFDRIVAALATAYERWAGGTYAIWYPLLDRGAMRGFERAVQDSGVTKVLQLELVIQPDDWLITMRGCGMLVVNPPWRLDEEMGTLLPWLWRLLSIKQAGEAKVRWLVTE